MTVPDWYFPVRALALGGRTDAASPSNAQHVAMHPESSSEHERRPERRRWTNPLTDGWEFRWNVLVALPGRSPEELDAVLASIGASETNTVVQLATDAEPPTARPSRNLVHAVAEPLADLLEGMDVAVVSGDAMTALLAAQRQVPLVVLPASDAEDEVGAAMASVGAGVVVRSAAEVGQAVRALASDGSWRVQMRGMTDQLRAVTLLLTLLRTSALHVLARGRRR